MSTKRINPDASQKNANIWTQDLELCCGDVAPERLCYYTISSFFGVTPLLSTAYSIDGVEYSTSRPFDIRLKSEVELLVDEINQTMNDLGYVGKTVAYKITQNPSVVEIYTAYTDIKFDYITVNASNLVFFERCCEGTRCPTIDDLSIIFTQNAPGSEIYTLTINAKGNLHCNGDGITVEIIEDSGPPAIDGNYDLPLKEVKGDVRVYENTNIEFDGAYPTGETYELVIDYLEQVLPSQEGMGCPQLETTVEINGQP